MHIGGRDAGQEGRRFSQRLQAGPDRSRQSVGGVNAHGQPGSFGSADESSPDVRSVAGDFAGCDGCG